MCIVMFVLVQAYKGEAVVARKLVNRTTRHEGVKSMSRNGEKMETNYKGMKDSPEMYQELCKSYRTKACLRRLFAHEQENYLNQAASNFSLSLLAKDLRVQGISELRTIVDDRTRSSSPSFAVQSEDKKEGLVLKIPRKPISSTEYMSRLHTLRVLTPAFSIWLDFGYGTSRQLRWFAVVMNGDLMLAHNFRSFFIDFFKSN
ncbi:hypothetical protein F5050DRAFT_1712715 [Lentinula boryana]|uniref:Uncharacterized protein n=1 Tax=Lentinula boryana TaxID=40481 RepID=A0ABQ8QAU0_9AGAR|nr:hypothetical protein F5050DRAFT_1712715 [Lentinula boryana]